MAEDKRNPDELPTESEYQPPAIEEVVTPERLEREVAYAGIQSNGQVN